MALNRQIARSMRIETQLGADVLMVERFTGEESVSQPFEFTLDLLSRRADIKAEQLLRTPVTLLLELDDGSDRPLHGVVRRFSRLGLHHELHAYRVEIVPWIWFLSLRRDCRVFQKKSALDVVKAVLDEAKGSFNYRVSCASSYPVRDYCVQYRESDLDFVSRLLEEEGIFYFFEHGKTDHVLVLADQTSAVKPGPGRSSVRAYNAPIPNEPDVATRIDCRHTVCSDRVALADYNDTTPSLALTAQVDSAQKGSSSAPRLAVFDYPGGFTKPDQGDRLARVRLEEQEVMRLVIDGAATARQFQSGAKIEFTGDDRPELKQPFLLLRVRHDARQGGFGVEDTELAFEYRNEFTAVPYAVPYRPARHTPRPLVHGSQTAVVVGPSGEEIYVDQYGRVKVHFFWDRAGKKDDTSSCWVRVSSAWAGKTWGAIQLPRIGQEVVVDFLEGDPDRPLIVGRVYNAEQMPPYALPANGTQSGVKTRSSKGASTDNFNELRFEDKKGSEQVYLHAERDLATEVEHDETHTVLHDRTTTVTHDDTRVVKEGNDTLTVKQGDQVLEISTGGQKITVQADHKITVRQGNHELTVSTGDVTTKAELGRVTVQSLQGIELKVGSNSIVVSQEGITIKGMQVKLDGQVQTEVKGLMATVKADGMLTMKGGITMIN